MIDLIKQQLTDSMPRHARLNRVREFLQVLGLKIMSDRGWFDRVAFLGGTSLRMLFQLRRFSEDLDFSLLDRGDVDTEALGKLFVREFALHGLPAETKVSARAAVKSIMIKFPGLLKELGLSPLAGEKLAIKWDADTNPPTGAHAVSGIISKYFTFRVVHYDLPSLFAGKLHACFYRTYGKGRDWYDFVWYATRKVRPNLELFRNAVRQTEGRDIALDEAGFADFLIDRVRKVDFESMRRDVERFLEDPAELSIFDKEAMIQTILNSYSDAVRGRRP
jgi:hypothetical protein